MAQQCAALQETLKYKSLEDRKCGIELYAIYRTRKFIKHCICVPWKVPNYQVRSLSIKYQAFVLSQDMTQMQPKGNNCNERNSDQSSHWNITYMKEYMLAIMKS